MGRNIKLRKKPLMKVKVSEGDTQKIVPIKGSKEECEERES